jgi:hypothetical protein
VLPRLRLFVLALATMILGTEGRSLARPYPIEIFIEDDADINQLFFDGEIDEEDRDALLTLYYSKLDLNLASREELFDLPGITYDLADRILALRKKLGGFKKLTELQQVDGIFVNMLRQIRPFVRISKVVEEKRYQGDVRLGGLWAFRVPENYKDPPSGYLRGRVRFLEHGGAGFLLTVRPLVGGVNDAVTGQICPSSDPQNCIDGSVNARPGSALSAAPEATRFDPSGFYAYWDEPRWSIIGGTYRIGYGLGLTLDNSGRQLPHGWYPNVDFTEDADSGKVRPYEGFVGLAARFKEIPVGPNGFFDLAAFGSIWNRDMYVYDVYYDRCSPDWPDYDSGKDSIKTCTDTGSGTRCGCTSTYRMPALVDQTPYFNPTTGQNEYASLYCDFPTLPGVMREIMGGANATYWFNRRSNLGFTGYASNLAMLPNARFIRPANASKYPNDRGSMGKDPDNPGSGTFGVWGLHTRFGVGRYDFAAEAAVNDKGAPAVLAKTWIRPVDNLEIMPSARFYHWDFDNPYNRGEANADELLGNRARDEAGGRVQVFWRPHRVLRLRFDLDAWYHRYEALPPDRPSNPGDVERDRVANVLYHEGQIVAREVNAVDLEGGFRAQVNPTPRESITLYFNVHDEDLSRGGRGLSYEKYASTTLGDLSGGMRLYWAVNASTTRIPRLRVSAYFKQIFEDTRYFDDRFDHSWYAWLETTGYFSPGPRVTVRFKYFDALTPEVENPAFWNCGFDPAQTGGVMPGSCRDETYIHLVAQLAQRLPWGPIAGSHFRLRGAWIRWIDDRKSWRDGYACVDRPSRDEIQIKGYLTIKF